MATAKVVIQGSVEGLPQGREEVTLSAGYGAAIGQFVTQALVSGNNAVTIPTGATGLIIQPPGGNAVALTLKGVNTDTGVALHLTNPTYIGLGTGATVVLNAGGSVTVNLIWL